MPRLGRSESPEEERDDLACNGSQAESLSTCEILLSPLFEVIQLTMGSTGDCLAGYEVQTSFLKSLNKKNEEERRFE